MAGVLEGVSVLRVNTGMTERGTSFPPKQSLLGGRHIVPTNTRRLRSDFDGSAGSRRATQGSFAGRVGTCIQIVCDWFGDRIGSGSACNEGAGVLRPRRAIPGSLRMWFWRCCCWAWWPRGFLCSVRDASIRWPCCARSESGLAPRLPCNTTQAGW